MEYAICFYDENGEEQILFVSHYETAEELQTDLKLSKEMFGERVFAEEVIEEEEIW